MLPSDPDDLAFALLFQRNPVLTYVGRTSECIYFHCIGRAQPYHKKKTDQKKNRSDDEQYDLVLLCGYLFHSSKLFLYFFILFE